MLILLSPAKKLDFDSDITAPKATKPRLLDDTNQLLERLKTCSTRDLASLMSLSEKLSTLNYERYQAFDTKHPAQKGRAALLAFKGDVYQQIGVDTYDEDDFAFAQKHVRILSGLYGLLRPLDAIQPYRLEMGTRLKTDAGHDLYRFWGGRITEWVKKDAKAAGKAPVVINLASHEYAKAVRFKDTGAEVITPVFKEEKAGKLKVIGLLAKRARGAMTEYVIRQRMTEPEKLKAFDWEGYGFVPELSDAKEWVFTRK